MSKINKILIASFLSIIFSTTSAFAFNSIAEKKNKTSIITKDLNNVKNSLESYKFNLCSSCPGCNGTYILNKLK